MYVVVCYDVQSNKRRTKLHKRLKGFLQPVQKSVFEGTLPEQRYAALLDMIRSTIDNLTDTVRVFHLCAGCRQLTDLIGTSITVPQGPTDVVIG